MATSFFACRPHTYQGGLGAAFQSPYLGCLRNGIELDTVGYPTGGALVV